MAQKTFTIDSFPQGYYMSWFVTTQAVFSVEARLFDNSRQYFDAVKQSTNIAPPLAQGADFIQGSGLKLLINIPQSTNIDSSINTYLITTDTGAVVGFGYNICIEDSYDKDFNDVCINLVAWKNRG
ncbi:MAG: hypothetical protein PHX14_11765 [Syntrophomonadaceae bacterium]|nr:hypothetical protein [Syntrophomonadaceae bacterium]